MDPDVFARNRIAALLFLAAKVEFTVQDMGLMDYFVDERGDGPYFQKARELHQAR